MTKKDMELKELSEEFEMFEEHGFSDVFHSEYDQTKQFNGMEFEVLGRVPLEGCWICVVQCGLLNVMEKYLTHIL